MIYLSRSRIKSTGCDRTDIEVVGHRTGPSNNLPIGVKRCDQGNVRLVSGAQPRIAHQKHVVLEDSRIFAAHPQYAEDRVVTDQTLDGSTISQEQSGKAIVNVHHDGRCRYLDEGILRFFGDLPEPMR